MTDDMHNMQGVFSDHSYSTLFDDTSLENISMPRASSPQQKLCEAIGLESLSKRQWFNIQKAYVIPVVNETWSLHNQAIMSAVISVVPYSLRTTYQDCVSLPAVYWALQCFGSDVPQRQHCDLQHVSL
ncbi:unnamed protein product [Boreogadus saida]